MIETLTLSLIFGSVVGLVLSTFFKNRTLGLITLFAIFVTAILLIIQST